MEQNPNIVVERLIEQPHWVIDLLPERVSQDSSGQFFTVERYYLEEPQHTCLCHRFADVLLKLNCYHDLLVSHDGEWVKNPDPATLATWLNESLGNGHLCALVDDGESLITASGGDTHMTLYGPSPALLELVGKLATASGLFLWQTQNNE